MVHCSRLPAGFLHHYELVSEIWFRVEEIPDYHPGETGPNWMDPRISQSAGEGSVSPQFVFLNALLEFFRVARGVVLLE